MDYDTNEIVITTYVNEEKVEIRVSEKDIESMKRWFRLAKHLNNH